MEKRMSRAAFAFPALIFALVAGLLASGFLVFDYSWGVLAFPFGAGIAVCALCAMEMTRTLFARGAPAAAEGEALTAPASRAGLAWIFALALFLYGLGFVFGPAAYLLFSLRASGASWLLSLAAGAGSLAVTWGLFIKVMGVLLPLAPLWWP